jgi:integrase
MPTRLCLPTLTSGGPYVSTGTPRRRSPGARWRCPRWRWKRSVSSSSGRQLRGSGQAFCWQDNGLVFTTALATRLDAADVRRSLRTICRRAGLDEQWTPRELRHTFVSLLSDNGMGIEEISRLVGHSSSNVTETVYRHQIRPIITVGAEAMDKIFASEH